MNTFADLVRVRNKHTGQIGRVARAIFENPRLNPGLLVEVDEKAKPFRKGHYKSRFQVATPVAVDPAPTNPEDD